jgi:hypothetical protein
MGIVEWDQKTEDDGEDDRSERDRQIAKETSSAVATSTGGTPGRAPQT